MEPATARQSMKKRPHKAHYGAGRAGVGLFALTAFTMSGACAPGGRDLNEARYQPSDCQRIDLVSPSGDKIVGAEDLAVNRRDGVLYISAYDRRAVEKAIDKRAASLPEGGLYHVPLPALRDATRRKTATINVLRLIEPSALRNGLRPHGISYDEDAQSLAVINRGYEKAGKKWRMTPKILRVSTTANVEEITAKLEDSVEAAHCAANDLWTDESGLLSTFDHAACDWRSGIEDVLGFQRSGVADGDRIVFNRAGLANGIARLKNGQTIVAATRQKALLFIRSGANRAVWRVKLPGGPDNLTMTPDGFLIAAVHPSLMRMGLHRKLDIGRAPSRLIEVDPETGAIELLFDDPKGAQFTAATVGVEAGGLLIAGSVTDAGLLVCTTRDAPDGAGQALRDDG